MTGLKLQIATPKVNSLPARYSMQHIIFRQLGENSFLPYDSTSSYVASLVNPSCGAGRELRLIPRFSLGHYTIPPIQASTHFDLHIHNKCEVKMAKATHSYQGYVDFGVSTVVFFVAFVKAFKVHGGFLTAVEIEKVLPFGITTWLARIRIPSLFLLYLSYSVCNAVWIVENFTETPAPTVVSPVPCHASARAQYQYLSQFLRNSHRA